MTKTTPVWMLDVDGVLNAVPDWSTHAPDDTWPDYTVCRASPRRGDDHKYKITYSPTLMTAIRELHESGVVEVRWLTTWGGGANLELADKLDLPHFEVAGEPEIRSGFAGAPNHYWWKFDDMRRAHAAEPHRPFVWTDDDLANVESARTWSMDNGVLAIATNQATGITPSDLERITHYIVSNNAMVA